MRVWGVLRQVLSAILCVLVALPASSQPASLSSSTPSHIYDAETLSKTRVWGSDEKILLHFRAVRQLSEKQHRGCEKCSWKIVVGSVVTYDYDAFGNLLHSTGTTLNNYLYSGEQFDPDLALYYNRARYLNTSTGRFWSMDDYEGDPQSPRSLHKYAYAGADAVNQKDPSGNDSLAEFSVATTVDVALSTFATLSVGAAINAAYGLSNLPKNPFSRLPDAGVVGFQVTANVGRLLRKVAKTPLEVGLSIGLQFLSVGGGFEAVVPRSLNSIWTYGFVGAFYSLPIGAAADNNGFVKDFPGIDILPGASADFLDAAAYGGGVWNVKEPADYAGPFECVSGAAVLRFAGINVRPDATVCSSPPKPDGTAGAYSLLYNRLGSGASVGTSITNYSYLGSFPLR